MARTDSKIDTPLANADSRPVRYVIRRADGALSPMTFDTRAEAAKAAEYLWPDQGWDEEHTGLGWDVQVVQ